MAAVPTRAPTGGRAPKAAKTLFRIAAISLCLIAAISAGALYAQDEPHIDDQSGVLASQVPDGILYPGSNPGFILVVFKAIQQLHIYRHDGNGNIYLVKILPCSTGMAHGDKLVRGDKKTPEGYYIFRQKLLPTELPDIYGILAYPMDYPNFWDKSIGRGGDGIWTHGINKPLVDYDSEGCIELLNHDLAELEPYIKLFDTPILVNEETKLSPAASLKSEGQKVLDFLENWRLSWTGKNLPAYAEMYDSNFVNSDSLSYKSWMEKKSRLAKGYQKIEVEIENIKIFRHRDTIVASFNQIYKGDNRFTSIGLKRLYLKEDGNGGYAIVAEEFSPSPGPQPNKWLTASQREWALTAPPVAVAQVSSPAAAAAAGVLMPPETTVAALASRTENEAEAAAEEAARAAIESRSSGLPTLASLAPIVNPELKDDQELEDDSEPAIEPGFITESDIKAEPSPEASENPAPEIVVASNDAAADIPAAEKLSEKENLAESASRAPTRQAQTAQAQTEVARAEPALAEQAPKTQPTRSVTVSRGSQFAGPAIDVKTVATVAALARSADSSSDASPASMSKPPAAGAPSNGSASKGANGASSGEVASGAKAEDSSAAQNARAAQDAGSAPVASAIELASSSSSLDAARPPAPTSSNAGPSGSPALDAKSAAALLNDWARSWSDQDKETYFSLYAPDFFFPDQSLRLPAFKRYRGGHMGRAAFIKIEVSDVDVSLQGSKAVVTFTQTYESDRNSDRGRKTLELAERDGRWMIISETFKPQS